ncbi:hypothetical protein CRV24_002459 [Beauveria bassiana]|nr:hypothetical protein CRV24_002459 [Beauveria bassiana]
MAQGRRAPAHPLPKYGHVLNLYPGTVQITTGQKARGCSTADFHDADTLRVEGNLSMQVRGNRAEVYTSFPKPLERLQSSVQESHNFTKPTVKVCNSPAHGLYTSSR